MMWDLIYVVDASESMNHNFNGTDRPKIDVVKGALIALIEAKGFQERARIGVTIFQAPTFAGGMILKGGPMSKIIVPLTELNLMGENEIKSIRSIRPEGATSTGVGISQGFEQLTDNAREKRIIVITDAKSNVGPKLDNVVRSKGHIVIDFIVMGIKRPKSLEKVANLTGGHFMTTDNINEFNGMMKPNEMMKPNRSFQHQDTLKNNEKLSETTFMTVFGMDYGTSELKFGPSDLGNTPNIIENRGYFPDTRGSMMRLMSGFDKKVLIVGPDVANFVEAKRDIGERMVYPMRSGVIERDDERSWSVVKELTRYALLRHPSDGGIRTVAALSAAAPRYMYEKIFDIHRDINKEEGKAIIKAVSVIPQPFAVAISQKVLACTVLEGGAGNTQVSPISSGMIFNALITMNRGGGDCDLIAAEILRDAGYGDLAREPKLVKLFKESAGLVPRNLKDILADKHNPKYDVVFKVPNTRISIDLDKNSWQRFLIGEYFFDPSNEHYSSYYHRGFPKPTDSYTDGKVISGTTDLAEVIIQSVQKCSFEIQPALYRSIFLSGGGFSWGVPQGMESFAVDSSTKLKGMLETKGIQGTNITLTKNPIYNVWQGCVAYGTYIPDDFTWDWDGREGWQYLDHEPLA